MKFKTFLSVLYNRGSEINVSQFISTLEKEGYDISDIWETNDWEAPKEYEAEMGAMLENKILVIKDLSLSNIKKLKLFLMEQEIVFSKNKKRTLDLNPGYLSQDGMFLITHKDNKERDRKKIGENIWQEKQYNYENTNFKFNSNTFSEYQDIERLGKFNRLFNS